MKAVRIVAVAVAAVALAVLALAVGGGASGTELIVVCGALVLAATLSTRRRRATRGDA